MLSLITFCANLLHSQRFRLCFHITYNCCFLAYLLLFTLWEFFTPVLADCLSPELEWRQVSRTPLNILGYLNDSVVRTVCTCPFISKYSSLFTKTLVTVRRAPTTIVIIVTFMFNCFFQFPRKVDVFILLFAFFQFYSVASRNSKVHNSPNSLFLLLIMIKSCRLVEIRWSVRTSKFRGSFCVSFSRTDSRLCLYHWFVCSYLDFLHSSKWITLPTQPSYTRLSVLVCCIRLICDWSFRLYHPRFAVLLHCYPLEFFTSALADGFFPGVWVTTSLLRSPGLFSVFWPFSIML